MNPEPYIKVYTEMADHYRRLGMTTKVRHYERYIQMLTEQNTTTEDQILQLSADGNHIPRTAESFEGKRKRKR